MSKTLDEQFDQRNHRRVPSDSQARVCVAGAWHRCHVVNLSGGGGYFHAPVRPSKGSKVLIQLRGLGIVRAEVLDRSHDCFAAAFHPDDYDANTLADNLMIDANDALVRRPVATPTHKAARPKSKGSQGKASQGKASVAQGR